MSRKDKRFIDKSGKEKIHLEYNMHRINFSKAANLKKRGLYRQQTGGG